MSTYKHKVENNRNMVQRLVKQSGVGEDLVQSIVWFSKCLPKRDTGLIDGQMFSVIMSTYFGIWDQYAVSKIYNTAVKAKSGMSVEQFSAILCIFFSSNLDVQIEYAFRLYDSDGNGRLDFSEVAHLIKCGKCMADTDDAEKDETFIDLCAMAMETLGINSQLDDGLTLDSFSKTVKENSLVIALLGQHVPPIHVLEKFRAKISGRSNLQMRELFGNIRSDLLFEPPDSNDPKYYPIQMDIP